MGIVLESKQSYIGALNEILQECEEIKIQKAEFHSKTIN